MSVINKQELEAAIERIAKYQSEDEDDDQKFTAYCYAKVGMTLFAPALLRAVEALEYIIEHERYHGVNQGTASDEKAGQALADIRKMLGVE